MTLSQFRQRERDEDERIRLANAAYDRIHGPARVVPIPPEHRVPVPDPATRRLIGRATRRFVTRLVADILDTTPDPRSDL